MSLLLRREAEADILEAFRWYQAKRLGLGDEFIAEVDTVFARAVNAPASFPVVYRSFRLVVLKRFPYLVYFEHADQVVEVFAVLHGRRNPAVLRGRLPR